MNRKVASLGILIGAAAVVFGTSFGITPLSVVNFGFVILCLALAAWLFWGK
jgi:hypothetical protein